MADMESPERLAGGVRGGAEAVGTSASLSVAPPPNSETALRQLDTDALREQAYMLERCTSPMFWRVGWRLIIVVDELMTRFLNGEWW